MDQDATPENSLHAGPAASVPDASGPSHPLKDAIPLRDLVGKSLLSGLCPLIPIPFLDDWLRDRVKRHATRKLTRTSGLDLDPQAVDILATGHRPKNIQGCVEGCLYSTVTWPARFLFRLVVKKILRKVIFVLAIKDCVDTFSASFHEHYLLRHALTLGALAGVPAQERVIAVRASIESVRDAVDHRPVERWAGKTFTASRRLLVATARQVTRVLRRGKRDSMSDDDAYQTLKNAESSEIESVIDELTEEIGGETGYLSDLEARLEQQLTAATPD